MWLSFSLDLRYFLFIFFLSFENLFNGKSYTVTENRETQPFGVPVFKYVKTESIKQNLLSKMVQVLLHPQWRSGLELCRGTLFLFRQNERESICNFELAFKKSYFRIFPLHSNCCSTTISSQTNLYSSLLGQPMFLKAISHNKNSYLHTNNFRYVVRMLFSKKKKKETFGFDFRIPPLSRISI